MPTEQTTFKEGGVTATLKFKQEQGEVRCTLLLDIEGVLGDPYEFVSPCTVYTRTSVAAAISDAAPAVSMAARMLMAMGERAAGRDALVVSHQIAEYANSRMRRVNPGLKSG